VRIAYWSLIQDILEAEFPEFLEDLRTQSTAEQHHGRVAMVEFQEGGTTLVKQFNNSKEFQSHFDGGNARKAITESEDTIRQLYVLEDLARANIEIIGSRVGIPAAFFAAHWALPTDRIATIDQFSLTQSRRQGFRLSYPELHCLNIGANGEYPLGLYADSENIVPRVLQLLDRERQFESSYHQVSFWSTTLNTKSWIGKLAIEI
jgi:hypothetical protein